MAGDASVQSTIRPKHPKGTTSESAVEREKRGTFDLSVLLARSDNVWTEQNYIRQEEHIIVFFLPFYMMMRRPPVWKMRHRFAHCDNVFQSDSGGCSELYQNELLT